MILNNTGKKNTKQDMDDSYYNKNNNQLLQNKILGDKIENNVIQNKE